MTFRVCFNVAQSIKSLLICKTEKSSFAKRIQKILKNFSPVGDSFKISKPEAVGSFPTPLPYVLSIE